MDAEQTSLSSWDELIYKILITTYYNIYSDIHKRAFMQMFDLWISQLIIYLSLHDVNNKLHNIARL